MPGQLEFENVRIPFKICQFFFTLFGEKPEIGIISVDLGIAKSDVISGDGSIR